MQGSHVTSTHSSAAPNRNYSGGSMDTKTERLAIKKKMKRNVQVMKIVLQIIKGKVNESIILIKEMIVTDSASLQDSEYIGWGNRQNWEYYYHQGPVQMLAVLQSDQYSAVRNPFDLLSIAFASMYDTKEITVEQILAAYDELSQILPQKRYQIYVCKGNAYYNDQQYLKAGEEYLKAEQTIPIQKVYQYLAWVYESKLKKYRLNECSSQCLEINPDNWNCKYIQIMNKNKNSNLVDELFQLRDEYPQYDRIPLTIAEILVSFNDSQQLSRLIEMVTYYISQNYPEAPKTLIIQAKKLSPNSHEYQQLLIQALQLNKQVDQVYYQLGMMKYQRDQPEQAHEYFQKCLQQNPFHLKCLSQTCILFDEEEAYEDAVRFASKYVDLDPFNPRMWAYLGKAQMGLGHYEDAIFSLRQSFKILEHESIAFNLAQCYLRRNQLFDARFWALKCTDLSAEKNTEAYQLLGDLSLKTDNLPRAIHWYLQSSCAQQKLLINLNSKLKLIPEREVERMLDNLKETQVKTEENVFWFAQISILYESMNCNDKALDTFWTVKEIVLEMIEKQKQIKEQLLMLVYGLPGKGCISFQNRLKWKLLAKDFGQQFQKIYSDGSVCMQPE